jgi:phosphoribosylglycinamide formyltransferase-1
MHKIRVTLLASGQGTNAEKIIEFSQEPNACFTVVAIISNNSRAGIANVAAKHDIPFYHCSTKTAGSEQAAEENLFLLLQNALTDVIALCGYNKLLPPLIVNSYKHRIMNIHPSLLPRHGGPGMYGLNVHKSVLEAGDPFTGATVHLVDEEYDTGTSLAQIRVDFSPEISPEALSESVKKAEYILYPQVINQFSRCLQS